MDTLIQNPQYIIFAFVGIFLLRAIIKGDIKKGELEAKLFTTDGSNSYAGETEITTYRNGNFHIEVEIKPASVKTEEPLDVIINNIKIGQATMTKYELELEYFSNPKIQKAKGSISPEISNLIVAAGDTISVQHRGVDVCKGQFHIDR